MFAKNPLSAISAIRQSNLVNVGGIVSVSARADPDISSRPRGGARASMNMPLDAAGCEVEVLSRTRSRVCLPALSAKNEKAPRGAFHLWRRRRDCVGLGSSRSRHRFATARKCPRVQEHAPGMFLVEPEAGSVYSPSPPDKKMPLTGRFFVWRRGRDSNPR